MDTLQIVRQWLEKQGITVRIDSCWPEEGVCGLYPLGRQVLRLREDVLGTVRATVRYSYLLKMAAVPGEPVAETVQRLQLAAATAPPKFGEKSRFTAHDGKLTKPAGDGLAWYELRLDAEREEENA